MHTHRGGVNIRMVDEQSEYVLVRKPSTILFLLKAPVDPEVEPSEPADINNGPGWMDQLVEHSASRVDMPA